MTKVMAFGTFDILHPGHLNYLQQAAQLGKKLVVVVATDKNVEKIKGKLPVNNQEHRKELVEALEIVDYAIIGSEENMFESVENENPNVIALGYDQKPSEKELAKKLEEKNITAKIARMKPYNEGIYKSSKIKEKVKNTKH